MTTIKGLQSQIEHYQRVIRALEQENKELKEEIEDLLHTLEMKAQQIVSLTS